MKNRDMELLRLAEKWVRTGRKDGADEIQVTVSDGSEFTVDIREGEIEKLLEADSTALSLKVIVDGRTATASSSDLSDGTLNALVKNAVQRAKLASPDPYAGLPDIEKVRPILFSPEGRKYHSVGRHLGKAFSIGREI